MTRAMSYGDPEVEGYTELPSLLEKARIIELRARLELVRRRSIPYAEFAALCSECGISQDEAARVAADLHKVGVLLHFSREPELSATVYLRPEEVLEDFFSRYHMDRYCCHSVCLLKLFYSSYKCTELHLCQCKVRQNCAELVEFWNSC
jgi:hypothetical protein